MQVLFELVKSLPYLFKNEIDYKEFLVETQNNASSDCEMEELAPIPHFPKAKQKKSLRRFEPMDEDKENFNFHNIILNQTQKKNQKPLLSINYSSNVPKEQQQFSEKCKRVVHSLAQSKIPLKRKIKALAQLHKLPPASQPSHFSKSPLEVRELEEEDLQESFEGFPQHCAETLVPKTTRLALGSNGNFVSKSKDRQKALRM